MAKILLSVLMLLFVGCSDKIALKEANMEKMHELSIINTRKGELEGSKHSKAIIIATYLNPLNVGLIRDDGEYFLVGVYIASDKSGLKNNPFYKIKLNSNSDIKDIERLDMNSEYLKLSPMVNRWAEYYLLRFQKQDEKKLILTFENQNGSKVELDFEKEY